MVRDQEETYAVGHRKFNPFDIQEGYIQVCSSLGYRKVIEKIKNGRPGAWDANSFVLCEDYYGEANPSICEDKPKTHKQYLFVREAR